jgi:hypothetical protein
MFGMNTNQHSQLKTKGTFSIAVNSRPLQDTAYVIA